MNSRREGAGPGPVSFGEALAFWAKLGCVSFGGPAGQIAIMHRELVERRRWISDRRFLHALNYCMLLPGPEAQQLATYLGWLMHGTRGGIAAGALFVLPSLALMILLSWGYLAWGHSPWVAGILAGAKPAVVAIVAAATLRLARRAVGHPWHVAIALAAFAAIASHALPFPAIVGLAALAGFAGRWIAPAAGTPPRREPGEGLPHPPAIHDDDTPTPAHAAPSQARLAIALSTGLALWALPFLALALALGAANDLTRMALFFSKAALVTFGGAYAVLPYVVDESVRSGWASAAQLIDGLALGETTPGPLIMIVAFVGFLGGWARESLGPGLALAAGVAGAGVATWFTFLPSFVFILAGGPFVERTRGHLGLARPLAAVTAAVVGVIASLALFLAWKVFWPQGNAASPFAGGFAGLSAALAIGAFVALARYRAGVIPVIAACATFGLVATLAGA